MNIIDIKNKYYSAKKDGTLDRLFTHLFILPTEETEEHHSLRCKLIKRMLLDGVNPNIVSHEDTEPYFTIGYTPLINCVSHDSSERKIDLLCLLLKYGRDSLEFTHVNTKHNSHFIYSILQLIDSDFNVWKTRIYPLLRMYSGRMQMEKTFEPVELTYIPYFTGKYDEGYEERFSMFRDLISLGGDPEAQDIDWECLLMHAVGYNDFRLVKYLLSKGANIRQASPYASAYDVSLGVDWRKNKCNPKMFRYLMNVDNQLSNIKYIENGYPIDELSEEVKLCIIREVKRGAKLDGIGKEWTEYLLR